VGQGDAIFIELPTKETMLIDAASSNDAPDIIRYIREAGYSKIDYVIATHPHADHIGGMAEVVRSLDIGTFYMPKKAHTTKTFENMLLAVKAKNLGIHTAKAGVLLIDQGNLKVTMVAPVGETYTELNDYSAVIRLDYGSSSFLFMGDAEMKSEEEITADIDTDVLKVGHHGSDSSTSESLLARVTPDHAVISAGEGNTYGHPTPTTLDALTSRSIPIYRTDLSGTIVFTSDGAVLESDKEARPQ
jgi:beta-lactamase superfamily II metal-dependent hydrolase